MKINFKIVHYKQLTALLEREATGSASELAMKIGVSRSTIFKMLDEIRGAGIAIKYNGNIKSYTYQNNKRLKISQPLTVIDIQSKSDS